ncbi:Protein LIKE COV 2 [Dichanthelium oligosanthes]|uniref:Protein LIKE COV 2 n=1 Tax=Dichanthelium oligosanthes TaxID=888268 RepID=A0A1E5V7D1_9POAL|nr:Protein LIKE COV 2 [Dichanthelium oligosanthes]
MPEDKEYAPVPLGQSAAEAAAPPDPEDPVKSPPRPSSPATSTRKACFAVLQSWVSRKFMTGCSFLQPEMFISFFFSLLTDQNTTAFKEVAIISHPRVGEYAFGFITSSMVLQTDKGDEELCSVYVPTNHLYIGDIFLVNSAEIIRPNLSIREGIEIIVSGGMTMPQVITSLEPTPHKNQSIRLDRVMTV